MSGTISVNASQQAIYTGDASDVTWNGEVVSDNNYGRILSVDDGPNDSYVVKTDKGTLTFSVSSPHLSEAKQDFAPFELAEKTFPEIKGFNWLEIAYLVLDSEKTRRASSRLIRRNARDTAFDKAMNSAKEMKAAAKKAFWMAVGSGAVSIIGGGVGIGGGVRSLSKACKACKLKTNRTALEADFSFNTQALAKNKARLKTLNAKGNKTKADLEEIADLQTEQQKIQNRLSDLDAQLDAKIDKAETKEAKAQEKRDTALTELSTARQDLKQAKIKRKAFERTAEDLDDMKSPDAKKLQKMKADEARLQKIVDKRRARLDKADDQLAAATEQVEDLQGLLKKTQRMRKADLAEVSDWASEAKSTHDKQLQEAQDLMTEVQAWTPLLNAMQGVTGGGSTMLSAGGQSIESHSQANGKITEAEITELNYQQENATESFQEANRAIQNFMQTWEKFMDSIKACQDRLVQA